MLLLAFCAVARASGICECLRHGLAWVRCDGTLSHDTRQIPEAICRAKGCRGASCVKGMLLLLPFRKNKQSTPSWMPVMERNALRLLCEHLRFLRRSRVKSQFMFIPRMKRIVNKVHIFVPSNNVETPMSPDNLRTLLRQAIRECCALAPGRESMFGAHSVKNGAVNALRASGVDSETRRQLGDWMSPAVALSYLQLAPDEQFSLIANIR